MVSGHSRGGGVASLWKGLRRLSDCNQGNANLFMPLPLSAGFSASCQEISVRIVIMYQLGIREISPGRQNVNVTKIEIIKLYCIYLHSKIQIIIFDKFKPNHRLWPPCTMHSCIPGLYIMFPSIEPVINICHSSMHRVFASHVSVLTARFFQRLIASYMETHNCGAFLMEMIRGWFEQENIGMCS